MIPTYSGVLHAIKKALWNLVKEYWSIRKSLQDLVEGQKRNIAQLARIGTTVDQRWGLKKEEDGNNKKGSEERSEESQEEMKEEILLFVFC